MTDYFNINYELPLAGALERIDLAVSDGESQCTVGTLFLFGNKGCYSKKDIGNEPDSIEGKQLKNRTTLKHSHTI